MTFGSTGLANNTLSGAGDVFLDTPVTGHALTYDEIIDKWTNTTISVGGGQSLTAARNTATSGALTLTAGTSATLTKFTGSLTANRTITLAAAAANSYFELSFIDTTFNTYSITITDGTFNHAFSYPTYVKYVSIAGVWERVL